jgi:prophage tail gpP-like protein
MEQNRAAVSMSFGDGTKITAWTSFSLRESFEDPLNELHFECAPPAELRKEYRQKTQKGEIVNIAINGIDQGVYVIIKRKTSVNKAGGTTYSIDCQTPLCTPYEASVDPHLSMQAPTDVPLSETFLKVLDPFGFDTIAADHAASVFTKSGRPMVGQTQEINVKALTAKEAGGQDNETAYAFCARHALRLGVCLRSTPGGEVIVQQPHYGQPTSYTVVQSYDGSGPGGDRLTNVEIEDTNEDQFSECIVRGQSHDKPGTTQASRPKASATSASLGIKRAPYRTPDGAPHAYKPKIVKDKNARDSVHAAHVAKAVLGTRAAKAYRVSGDVDGLISTTGRVWTVDTMCWVHVEADEISEPMYLLERTLMQDKSGGQRAHLVFIQENALQIGDSKELAPRGTAGGGSKPFRKFVVVRAT